MENRTRFAALCSFLSRADPAITAVPQEAALACCDTDLPSTAPSVAPPRDAAAPDFSAGCAAGAEAGRGVSSHRGAYSCHACIAAPLTALSTGAQSEKCTAVLSGRAVTSGRRGGQLMWHTNAGKRRSLPCCSQPRLFRSCSSCACTAICQETSIFPRSPLTRPGGTAYFQVVGLCVRRPPTSADHH